MKSPLVVFQLDQSPDRDDEPPYLLDDDGDFFIFISKDFGEMNANIKIAVSDDYNVQMVKAVIRSKWGIAVRDQRLHHGSAELQDDMASLADYNIKANDYLKVSLRLTGGGFSIPTRKQHLKKDEALNKLKKTLGDKFKDDDAMPIVNDELSSKFVEYLKEIKDKTDQVAALKVRLGEGFYKTCIRQVPVEDLKTIGSIFSSNRSVRGQK
eukprot:Skav225242  [mRNA]  locus=scaffold3165:6676:7520:- [translate_table: standard]